MNRSAFGGQDTNLKWFEYRRLARAKFNVDVNLIVPQIAMYNHAFVCDHTVAFKEKAQAIALKSFVSKQALHALAAFLNSSTAGFWLKQVCFNKGPGKQGEHDRFEFSGNILGNYTIPKAIWDDGHIQQYLARLSQACADRGRLVASLNAALLFSKPGEAYDNWYRGLKGYVPPHHLIATPFESRNDLIDNREKARNEGSRLINEMVALQEEIDWVTYAACGLIPVDHSALGIGIFPIERPWGLNPGHRAFELALNSAGPPTEWEAPRRDLWARRLETIKEQADIASIEHSVFKRRWTEVNYEKEISQAFPEWLLEKAEFYLQHSVGGGPISIDEWSAALWQDHRVKAAVFSLEGPQYNLKRFTQLLKKTVDRLTVPTDSSRVKTAHKQLRGKLNVPRERFRSHSDHFDVYSWAGKK